LVAKFSNPPFGRVDATAVEDLCPVALQPTSAFLILPLAFECADDRGELTSTVSNQLGGYARLKGTQLVVDRRREHVDLF
jgi:hypothetical protein